MSDIKNREFIRTLHSMIADFLRDNPDIDRSYYQEIWDWLEEKEESDDERIREWLVDYFKKVGKSWIHRDISPEQVISYLEKQKELPFVKDVMLGYPAIYFYDGERMHFQGNPAMEEKHKEQQPTEKSSMLKKLKEHLANTPKEQLDTEFDSLKHLTTDKSEEWSKDERIRKALVSIVKEIVGADSCYFSNNVVSKNEVLAYLERQKEPTPIPDKFSGLKSLMLQYLQSAANRKDDAEIESDTDLWGRKILDYVWKCDAEQIDQEPIISVEEFFGITPKEYNEIKDECIYGEQKEQQYFWKPTEEDITLFNKAVTTNKSLTPQDRAKLDIIRMKFKHHPNIEQKEQKSAECELKDAFKNYTDAGITVSCGDMIASPDGKPLFKKGDWVVYEGVLGHGILQVKDIKAGRYTFVDNESTLLAADSDKCLRPLTPKDLIKPAEWNDEDKEMSKRVHGCVARLAYGPSDEMSDSSYYKDTLSWFENRFKFLCPPQWSEEDEKMRNKIIGCLSTLIYRNPLYEEDVNEGIAWLKSFRPQSYLKLDKKQKTALWNAIGFIQHRVGLRDERNGSINGMDYPDMLKLLESLYDDLKKL